jgi:hypothetical protein
LAKVSGLGATVVVADDTDANQTISDDVTEFGMSTPRGVQDVTGVDVYAHQRLLLLADCTFSLKLIFDNAANMGHMVLSTMSSTSVLRSVQITPTATEYPFLGANCYVSTYDVARSATGELTSSSELMLGDGQLPTWTNAA